MSPSESHLPHKVAQRYCHTLGAVADYLVPLSEGCSVATTTVEEVLGKTLSVVHGSCKFEPVHASVSTNQVKFRIEFTDGRTFNGLVVVRMVAYDALATAYAVIRVDSSALDGHMKVAQLRLVEAAEALRSKVYSSLPWGYRLASLLLQVRVAADPQSFGRLVYGVFLLSGVRGMPPTPEVPTSTKEIDRLPRTYGLEFGTAAKALAARILTDEDQVDDLLSAVALKVLSEPTLRRAIAGKPIAEAKSYIFKVISNQAKDVLRHQKVRLHQLLDDTVGDPSSWAALGRLIPERERNDIEDELKAAVSPRFLPDLPTYLDLLLDGHSNKEIAEKRLLPSLREQPISQQALAKYRTKVKEVLERHFQVQSCLMTG